MFSKRKHPTLLVCGIAGGSLSLWLLEKRLRRAGIHTERQWSSLVLRQDVEFYAKRLRKHIQKICEKTEKLVTIVGWSMGGLIAVQAMSDPYTAQCVRRIITFGAPFDGSYPAYALAHRLGQLFLKAPEQILPGSSLLKELADIIQNPHRDWEMATINGPPYLDPFAPAPLTKIQPDLRIAGNYAHTALFANRALHQLVTKLILTYDLTAHF